MCYQWPQQKVNYTSHALQYTHNTFSFIQSCSGLPNVNLAHQALFRVASAYTQYLHYLATQEVLNGAILTSCKVISPTNSFVTSVNLNSINFAVDEPIKFIHNHSVIKNKQNQTWSIFNRYFIYIQNFVTALTNALLTMSVTFSKQTILLLLNAFNF